MKLKFIVIVTILMLLIGFLFFYSNYKKPENNNSSNPTKIDRLLNSLKFDHTNITYYLNKQKCGAYETSKIISAMQDISKSTKVLSFIEKNISDNPDIKIDCSFISNCYKKDTEITESSSDYAYYYEYEYTCPYPKGITTINVSSDNKILNANIEMVGLYEFSENGKSNQPSGFSIGDCGYPLKEARELLKAIMGYGGGYDSEVQPIYSFTWELKEYGILNPYKLFKGFSTYVAGDCKNVLKEIDPWIIEDIRNVYSTNPQKNNYSENCLNLPTTDRMDWCQFNSSIEKKDVNLCKAIKDPFIKEGCYQKISWILKDTAFCYEIQDEGIRSSCFFNLANLNKKSYICENINNATWRSSCFTNVSIALKSPDICSGITNIQEEKNKDWCLIQSGTLILNSSVCEKISSVEKNYCQAIISGKSENCTNLNSGNDDINYCLWWQASILNDFTFCKKMTDTNLRNYCYEELARTNKDGKICSYINSTWDNNVLTTAEIRDECYYYAAYEKKEASLCSNLNTDHGWNKNYCYWVLANLLKKEDICSYIQDSLWKDYCIKGIFLSE